MGKIAAYLLAGTGIGLGLAWWLGADDPSDEFGSELVQDDRTTLEKRLGELETELALERLERQALADELDALSNSLLSHPEQVTGSDTRQVGASVRQGSADSVPADPVEYERYVEQRQIDRFVAAGLSASRARLILQREEELQMDVLRARYEATRNGATAEEVANLSLTSLMRTELGDADYEKYLLALGRPTSISVREVLTNSPAEAAGLQTGDEIVAYNGKRVFEMNELTEMTYQARPGSAVAIDIERGGQRMQVYVEGGPIGISGGGRSRREVDGPGRR